MIQIKCLYCGKAVGSTGLRSHLQFMHKKGNYEAELDKHGYMRMNGRLVDKKTGELVGGKRVQRRSYTTPYAPEGYQISEEALRLALGGLQKLHGELTGHIADLQAQLDAPLRKTRKPVEEPGWPELAQQEMDRMAEKAADAPVLHWTPKRHWSNDPERKWLHNGDGTIRLDEQGNKRLKPKGFEHSGRQIRKRIGRPPGSKSAPILKKNAMTEAIQ